MPPIPDYFLCGWRLRSEIPLPELLPWPSTVTLHPVDIHLRLAPLAAPAGPEGGLTVDPDRACHLDIPNIARFDIRNGRDVLIDPLVSLVLLNSPGFEASLELRNYLFGTGLGLLCHQRGVFPLHGSCLALNGQAIIFSGHSGAGKSTLAAALAQRGHPLLSDDVCVLEDTPTGWIVQPAFPCVKLLPTSLETVLGLACADSPTNLQGKHHFRFDPVPSFAPQPVPLSAIYFLETSEAAEPTIADVLGLERIALLQSQIFRRAAGEQLGRRAALFTMASRITAAVPIRRLCRPFDLTRLHATIALLEATHVHTLVAAPV